MSKKIIVPVLILGVMSVTGCSLMKSEKQSYIDANIEAACALSELNLTDINQDNSEMIKDIYEKHGFPVDDEVALTEYLSKFESDAEVQQAIADGSAPCRQKILDNIMNVNQELPKEEEVEMVVGTGETSDVE
jgi:hypothetical protein